MAKYRPPTKVQQAAEERKWRAESLVKDTFLQTPEAKRQIKDTIKTLRQQETDVKKALTQPTGKKGK